MSTASWALGAAAAGGSLVGVLLRLRPDPRMLVPLVALAPLAAAILVGGGRLSTASLQLLVSMIGITAAVMLVARQGETRQQLLWLLAAIGPLAGIAYCIEPQAASAVELAPIGVVAAWWLYLKGNRWALVLGLIDASLVIFVEPLAAWLGTATAVLWLAVSFAILKSPRRHLAVAGGLAAGLAVATACASLAGTTPSPGAAWSMRLSSADSSVRQDITVDRSGDTALWIYARRSSEATDYPFSVTVNGEQVTTDLNSYLLTDPMAWARVPLPATPHPGDRLEVRIQAEGAPNGADRYIDIGGVYATVDGISSPGVNGTYLIVLGDDSMPLAPNGLPEPMVRNRLQPPMGAWMPGELRAPAESRQGASVLGIWQQTLAIALRHPFGVGSGNLGSALQGRGAGLGPGLTARSQLMQALGEWGWPGLAALLLVLAAAGWAARRANDSLAIALLGVAVITMLGESVLAEPAGAASVWLALGFCFGSIASRVGVRPTSTASDGETRPETSRREAIHAG
jgi:hypothetical protein